MPESEKNVPPAPVRLRPDTCRSLLHVLFGSHAGQILVAILLAAFILRCGAAFYWETKIVPRSNMEDGAPAFYFGDSDSYWQLGRAIAEQRSYQFDEERHWTVFRMPGYPMILAPLFYLQDTPPVFSARILNCCLGTFTVALVALLAWVLFGNRTISLLAATIAAIDPCLMVESITVLSEEPFQVAMLLQLIVLVLFLKELYTTENPQKSFYKSVIFHQAIALGLLSAMTVYFRPSWLYFAPFVLFIAFLTALLRREKRIVFSQIVKTFIVSATVFCLCMSPWWVRNTLVTGTFVPTTLQMGASLYDGLNLNATGASDMSFVDSFRESCGSCGTTIRENGEYEVRLDRTMKQASLNWLAQNPGKAIQLAGVKFQRLWNFIPNEPGFRSGPIRLALIASYTPVLVLGLIGFFCLLRKRRDTWLLILPAVYLTLLHIIFVSSLRYRIPAMPIFMILTAWCLVGLLRRQKNDEK